MNKHAVESIARLTQAGITTRDALALRRISMTLHRWFELECGDSNDYASWAIERDETTDKPFMVRYPHDGKSYRTRIADRENGARKRLAAILSRYPELTAYVQTDPRGCALYILHRSDVDGAEACQVYNSRGIAVIGG